jgi:hypothetical protein
MDDETLKEIVKATGKAIELFDKVFGDSAAEMGGIFTDRLKLYRYKNAIWISDQIDAILKSRKREGKSIPLRPRFALPILRAASEEDEPSIQMMWAGLMANAMDPERRSEPKKVFIQILSSIEPTDAHVLQFLANMKWRNMPDVKAILVSEICSGVSASEKDVRFALQNLNRLGCVDDYNTTYGSVTAGSSSMKVNDPNTAFRLTPLGFDLVEACDSKTETEAGE